MFFLSVTVVFNILLIVNRTADMVCFQDIFLYIEAILMPHLYALIVAEIPGFRCLLMKYFE